MQEKPEHIIGVIGVRDFKDQVYSNRDYLERMLLAHIKKHSYYGNCQIVTGGSKGVESLVVDIAELYKIPVRKIPPNIQQYGAMKAFSVRNATIVNDCTDLVVFWDGTTKHPMDALMTAMLVGRTATVFPLA